MTVAARAPRPRADRRHRGARQIARGAAATVAVAAVAVAARLAVPGASASPRAAWAHRAPGHATPPLAVGTALLRWSFPLPISREVVLPASGHSALLVAGGLDAAGVTTGRVVVLRTTNGASRVVGSLATPTHDAGGALLAGAALVIGGGSASPIGSVQRVTSGARAVTSETGTLPQPRSDLTAVTIGRTAYVVGGYDGLAFDPEVLATTDGRSFRTVAALPVPVRYPAVAVMSGRIYVFGGEAADGSPVSTVQVVDPATGRAAVVGRLPVALEGAVAAVLGGTAYVVGGESPSAASGLVPVAQVYAYEPTHDRVVRAGSLRVAVTNAGAAVLGSRLFVVGGEIAGGAPTADVQSVQRR